jgi:GNAT superfamily N-acetyltransferase
MNTSRPECEIEVIYIKPEYRRLGFSSALIKEAIAWAKDQQAWRIKTEIFAENTASQTTFEQQGFKTLHVTKICDLE